MSNTMKLKIEVTSVEQAFNALNLAENTAYKVLVKVRANNPSHVAILFTGFKNGNYCEVYSNTYGSPVKLKDVYSIVILKKLTELDDRGNNDESETKLEPVR